MLEKKIKFDVIRGYVWNGKRDYRIRDAIKKTFNKRLEYKAQHNSLEQLYKLIMNDKLSLNEGMIYENAISQIIASKGKKLYFYTRYSKEKHRNDIEIDLKI